MRVVQVVRRAHRQPVDAVPFAPQLLQVPLEALGLGEELRLAVESIEHADRIVRVERGDQLPADVLDRLHVARGNEAGGTDESEAWWIHARKNILTGADNTA